VVADPGRRISQLPLLSESERRQLVWGWNRELSYPKGGCLAERFDVDRPEGKVQVIYPLLEHSADPNLYRDVQLRERWMDFLLGHSPTASEHDPEGEPVEPLPSSLVDALRIRLNPPQLKT
jgi:hypothetical protein